MGKYWISYKDEHICPVCHETTIRDASNWNEDPYLYCPWCGAKLDVEENSDAESE